MSTTERTKKLAGIGAVALGLMLGTAGIASAVTGGGSSDGTPQVAANGLIDDDGDNDDTPEEQAAEQALLDGFTLSPADAGDAALAAVPGTIQELDIDDDGLDPVFEIEIIDANGQEVEVLVDPNSGEILRQKTEDEDDAAEDAAEQALIESFALTPEEAGDAALAAVPGTLKDVDVEDDGVDPLYEVEIIDADGQEIEVLVDPSTGEILRQQVDVDDDAGTDNNTGATSGNEVTPGN